MVVETRNPQGFVATSAHLAVPPNDFRFPVIIYIYGVVICYYLHVPFVRIRMEKGMGKERRVNRKRSKTRK